MMRARFSILTLALLLCAVLSVTAQTGGGYGKGGKPKATPTPSPAPATDPDGTWTANSSGNWSSTANWLNGIVADNGGFANFSTIDITTNVVVTIDISSRTVRRIDIGDTNHTNSYTIAANAGLSLIFDNTANNANAQLNVVAGSGNVNISAPVVLNSSLDITNASGFSLNISGGITAGTPGLKTITTSNGIVNLTGIIGDGSGTVSVVQNGSGTLRLSAANTFTGGTTINGGIVEIGTSGVVSAGGTITSGPLGKGTLTLANGATLRSNGSAARTIQNNLSLNGNITLGATATNTGTLTFNSTDGTNSLSTPATATLTGNTTLTTNVNVTIADAISGAFNLTKAGASTLTLSGANTFSGTTAINAGNLLLGNSLALQDSTLNYNNQGGTLSFGTLASATFGGLSGAQNLALTNTGSANVALTVGNNNQDTIYSGILSGGGSLTKVGTGTLTLSGANTYSGGTTLNAGTLQLGASSTGSVTNGPVGTGILTLNGGTLSSDSTTARTIANATTFGGNVTFGTNTNFGALTLSGAGTLSTNSALTLIADVTYSGNIGESGGSFGITKNGSGTLILSGINTYSGGTTLNAGLLELKSTSALGSANGSLIVNGGILDLNGQSVSVGNLSGTGGTIWNNGPNAGSSTVTLTIGSGNATGGNYAGTITDNNGAAPLAKVALTKTGTGTITLSGANSYTGATTINGGTLLVNGSLGAGSAVTVNNTGTLGGTGTVGGSVDVKSGGTLSPGASIGTLHTGALTLENGSTFAVDLSAASGNDLVVAPSVTLGTILTGPGLSLNITGSLSIGQTFFIVDNTGLSAVSGVFAQGATITSGAYEFLIDYTANFDTNSLLGGNDIALEVIEVPEPGTWLAAALAVGGLVLTQRKRFKQLIGGRPIEQLS